MRITLPVHRRWGTRPARAALVTLLFLSATAAGGVASGAQQATDSAAAVAGAGRVIEIRPHRLDLRADGRLVRSIWRPSTSNTLDGLRRAIGDPSWIRLRSAGTYELAAAIYQAPGTALSVAAPKVRTLRLLDQPAPRATWIRGSRATVAFRDVTVTGGQPQHGAGAGASALRPYIAYTNGSQVTITGSTFTALGRPGHDTTGVSLLKGSSGSVTASRFEGNQQGLTLDNPGAVTVRGIIATGSAGTGLVLKGGRGLLVQQVTSFKNGGDGVGLSAGGVRNRLLVLAASRNGRAGLAVRGQRDLGLVGVRVGYNALAGVALETSQRIGIRTFRADGERRALDIGIGTSAVTLSEGTITGGATGIYADGTRQLTLSNARVADARDVGYDLAGVGLSVRSSQVDRSPIGLQLRDGSRYVRIANFQATGTSTGVAIKALASDIRLDEATVTDARDSAVSIAGSRVQVAALVAQNATTGVDVYGRASSVVLDRPTILQAAVGVAATGTTTNLQVQNARVDQQTGTALSSSSPGLVVTGGALAGASLGLDLHADTTVTGVSVSVTHDAVRVGSNSTVNVARSSLLSSGRGVRVARGGHASIQDSTVTGSPALSGAVTLRGRNQVPPAPTPWLGIAAAVAVGAAVVLEALRRLREHETDRRVLAPLHVARPG